MDASLSLEPVKWEGASEDASSKERRSAASHMVARALDLELQS